MPLSLIPLFFQHDFFLRFCCSMIAVKILFAVDSLNFFSPVIPNKCNSYTIFVCSRFIVIFLLIFKFLVRRKLLLERLVLRFQLVDFLL
jgi:hypothetical protein